MDNTNDTTIQHKNKHLNAFERGQIQFLNAEGLSPYAIDKRLNRSNCVPKSKFLSCADFIKFVEDKFFDNTRSIDSICGISRLHKLFDNDKMVCTKTL